MDPIAQRLHQAIAWYQSGQTAQAETALQAVAQEAPQRADVWGLLGLVALQRGAYLQAAELIQRAITLDPNMAAYHSNLGAVYASLGDRVREETAYREALRLQPNDPVSLGNLATLLVESQRWNEALDVLRQVVEQKPNEASWQTMLGETLRQLRRCEEAVACYERALQLDSQQALAHNGLGLLAVERGELALAEQHYRSATHLVPHFFSAHSNLGNILAQRGDWLAAVASYRAALVAAPQFAEGHANLANVLTELGQLDEAVLEYRQAIQLKPYDPAPYANLAEALIELGEVDEAERLYERLLTIDPNDGVRVRAAIAMPGVARTAAEIERHRQRVAQNLERLRNATLRIADPLATVGAPLFFAAYHGAAERPTRQALAEILRRASPVLSFVAPHCRTGRRSTTRPRIGFISRFFHTHSIARHFTETLRQLKAHEFEIVVIRFPGVEDQATRAIVALADRVVTAPLDLPGAQNAVAAEQLDLLCYTDLGMDPLTYHLAFSRLAPVQCVLPGHPVTSGIDTIDYYLSADTMEPADAATHYTERLVRFHAVPTNHLRPELPPLRKPRRDVGWDDNVHYYLCAQPMFKLHPDFDRILREILRGDANGRLVLFRDYRERWNRIVEQRLQDALGEVHERIVFLSRLPHEEFWQRVALADVVLDTPHFNGGTTTLQTLGIGTPVVTLPGEFMRNRVTYGCYRRMDLLDAVAESPADYVSRAIAIASDRARRTALVDQIRRKSRVLFEENGFVAELAAFFRQVLS